MNVALEFRVFSLISDPAIVKAGLPNLAMETQFLLCAVREPTFDKLNCLLQCDRCNWRDQQMKVIGHDHKLVKQIPSLLTVVEEHVEEKLSHPVRLEKSCLLEC